MQENSRRERSPFKTVDDSTSPISSSEFATADFYFEDAMPSPKGSDSVNIASLQAELLDKVNKIRELEETLSRREGNSLQCATEDFSSQTLVAEELSLSDTSGAGPVMQQRSSEVDLKCHHCDLVHREKDELVKKLCLANDNLAIATTKSDHLEAIDMENKTSLKMKTQDVLRLEEQLKDTNKQLENINSELEKKQSDLRTLEQCLSISNSKNEELQSSINKAEGSLVRVRSRLCGFRDEAKRHLPSFRSDLENLKKVVLHNRQEVDSSLRTTTKSLHEKVDSFNKSVLSDAFSKFEIEKQALTADILRLKAELVETKSHNTDTVISLNKDNEELSSRLLDSKTHFTKKFEEQQAAFDSTLKELETKHSLELELELDRCKMEMDKRLEDAESATSSQVKIVEETRRQFQHFRNKAAADIADLESQHREKVKELQEQHDCHLRAEAADLSVQLQADFDLKLAAEKDQIDALKVCSKYSSCSVES